MSVTPSGGSSPPTNLWPAKLVYLTLNGGLAAFFPFLPVFLKAHGLAPSHIGALVLLFPIATVCIGPMWTAYADAQRAHRLVLLCTITIGTALRCGVVIAVLGVLGDWRSFLCS